MTQTPDHIIKKAEKEFPESVYMFGAKRLGYIRGLTEAINTEPLRKTLQWILDLTKTSAISVNGTYYKAFLGWQEQAREALALPTGDEGKEVDDSKAIEAAKKIGILSGPPLAAFIDGWNAKPTPAPKEDGAEAVASLIDGMKKDMDMALEREKLLEAQVARLKGENNILASEIHKLKYPF